MKERAVLDIVDLSTLQFAPAETHVRSFFETWGVEAEAAAIPILSRSGIPFENPLTKAVGIKYKGKNDAIYLGAVVEKFASLGLDIYLTLSPTLEFVRSEALHLIDISGDSSHQACIAKTATRRFLRELIDLSVKISKEACDDANKASGRNARLKGLAIDLTNILPMGASKERIELTCFCADCREQLASLSKMGRRLVSSFETFPNPWSLALKDAGSGISYISDMDWGMTTEGLLGLSKLQGFDEYFSDDKNLIQSARTLIDYLHTRHNQIVNVTNELFSDAIGFAREVEVDALARVIILEGTPYIWTAGLFLEKLDDPSVCDELWFASTGRGLVPQRVSFRSYMWKRTRYVQDAFFALVEHAQDEGRRASTGLARMSVADLKKQVEQRRTVALSARLEDRLDLFVLPEVKSETGRIGFVGSNLTNKLSSEIVSSMNIAQSYLARDELQGMAPQDLIDLLKRLKDQ